MEDLSLHIMDIAENSLRSGARHVGITLIEDRKGDLLTLEIADDGKGMDDATEQKAADPFFTTKEGKRFGLGLSLLAQSAEEAGGYMTVESGIGRGTKVTAKFVLGHIDRRPLGDIEKTVRCLTSAHPDVIFEFRHIIEGPARQ